MIVVDNLFHLLCWAANSDQCKLKCHCAYCYSI